jgi:pSer/pThr/pTyr-binding forkhead associated (FHA) protein
MISHTSVDSIVNEGMLAIPVLLAIRGPLADHVLSIGEPVVSIGRQSSNVIVVEDPLVSRHHCVIRNEGEKHTIEDLNSSNGTYVNGEPVEVASLDDDALIEIGASSFLFKLRNSEE